MWLRIVFVSATVMALLGGCGGNQPAAFDQPAPARIVALNGSSTEGITLQQPDGLEYVLDFRSLPASGQFIRLALPDGNAIGGEEWQNDSQVLHVIGGSPAGVDIGVIPLADFNGESVRLTLTTQPGVRTVSTPPLGTANSVQDLTILDLGGGQMQLDWTELNAGDYNLNTIVEVADLTPLGINFGETYDTEAADKMLNPLYWVDGNRNGLIEVSDITPIGQNFGSQLVGYNVLRNGDVVSGPTTTATIERSEAEARDDLPPVYTFTNETERSDVWSVAPVDAGGVIGAESIRVSLLEDVDLQVTLSITGMDLLDLDGSGASGPLGSTGRSEMQVVSAAGVLDRASADEIMALTPVGGSFNADTPVAQFSTLPREQALALVISYEPVEDLVGPSGPMKKGTAHAAQAIAIEHEITVVPFRLPADSEIGLLEVAIEIAGDSVNGYSTFVSTIFDDGQASITKIVQLAHGDTGGRISMDNDRDDILGQEFDDEPWLNDLDKLAVSDRRLEREVDRDLYGDPVEYTIYGRVNFFSESAGALGLADVYIQAAGEDELSQLTSLMLFFSEDSDFGGQIEDMIPGALAADTIVRIEADRLDNAALDPAEKYWLRELYTDGGEFEPQAVLVATPNAGLAPLLVNFDASASQDILGEIVKYEFDFGDGSGWEDYGLTDTASYTYMVNDDYTAYLRVTDDDGNVDIAQADIMVGEVVGEGTVNITITIDFKDDPPVSTTHMTTRVAIYNHAPLGLTDINWIGREVSDPNPYGRQDTVQPQEGVPQTLNWEGIIPGDYWYSIYRSVTEWPEGGPQQYAVFGPFTVNEDTHNFDHNGFQYANPPPPLP